MKILFISDIHGITDNLKIIEKKLKEEDIDKLVCLGDLYYTGPSYEGKSKINSKDVFEFLTKYSDILICMMGNCDSNVDIKASDFPISSGVSLINTDGLDIYITHGNEYRHEHIPYIKKNENMIYVNVGSISLPKDNNNPTYAIYENKNITIYDIYENIVDSIDL